MDAPGAGGDGGQVEKKATGSCRNSVVSVDEVIARRGHISVAGRYTCDRRLEEDYHLETKVVGSGMSGPVCLATSRTDGSKMAVKSFKKKGLSTRRRAELKNEVEIYLSLDHPHIARLEKVFETEEELHLVMEYMAGGELYDRLASRKQYSEEDAAETTHEMLLAVAYLHAHSIAHRDLKLENFLYEATDTSHLKLIDFGFAKFWDRSTTMSQACGSVHYVAPEVLQHAYTEKADMWSLGVIVYMLLTGSPPFHGSDAEVLKKIKAGTPHWSSRFKRLTEPAQNFVRKLLVSDPVQRLSAAEAIEDDWLKNKGRLAAFVIDGDTLQSLRNFAHASSFRRAVLSMMAWSLSTDERTDLWQQFLSLDKEKKGTITHTQMKAILEENFHVDSHEAEHLFKSLDTDNDNEIAYSEFLAAALLGRVKVHEDLLRKTFARFDADKCNKISAADLKLVLGEHFEGADVEELIREADTDNDGNIDYDEFLAYFHKQDVDELAAALAGPGGLDESTGDHAEDDPVSRKSKHTEKLAMVLDRLIIQETSHGDVAADASPAGSPGSRKHKPLLTRQTRRAKTMM